jgi:hypothetical protein
VDRKDKGMVSAITHTFFSLVWALLELSSNASRILVGSWLFCMQNFPCLVNFSCMFGVRGGLNEEHSTSTH